MLELYARPNFQIICVDPLARWMSRTLNITPNTVTLLAGLFGIIVPLAIVFDWPWLAASLLLVSGYLDSLDGTIARIQNTDSAIGSVLDICMDRLVEFAVIYGLFLVQPSTRGNACLLMLGSILLCITSFLVVGIFTENDSHKSFHYSPGLIERFEAFVFFCAMILLPVAFSWLAYTFATLVLLTAIIRIRQFFKLQHKAV